MIKFSMNSATTYDFKHTYHLRDQNKLWGCFFVHRETAARSYYPRRGIDLWCWWAENGKSIHVKKHRENFGIMRSLCDRKEKNGYQLITQEQLLELWPSFMMDLENKMIFEMLRDV